MSEQNKQAYNTWSQFYDSYPNPTVAIDDLHFPELYLHLEQKNVLEIGCGTGRHTVRLVAQQNQVTALDISPGMLAVAREKIKDNVTFIEGDFLKTEFNQKFDAIVMSLVLEHIADLEVFFAKAGRILKPGGELIFSDIHPYRSSQGVLAHFKTNDGAEVHLKSHSHSEEQIKKAAKNFIIVECETFRGSEKLARLNPKWEKHLGIPMVQAWVLKLLS